MSQKHVLIINQHGDNRGDEAAIRAMIGGFQERLGDVRFTVLHQFADRDLRPDIDGEMAWHSLILSPVQGLKLLWAALLRPFGMGKVTSGGSKVQDIRAAYETADLVVNAPGGPYFGDIYAGHEIIHWFYVWIAKRYGKPMFHYATSAGPFETRWLNPIRKWLFRKIDVICIREEVSAGLLATFIPSLEIEVTADSALQRTPPKPSDLADQKSARAGKVVLGASARLHQFANISDREEREKRKAHYVEVLENAIRHVAAKGADKLVLFPQLYGRAHTDVPFLEEIGARIGDAIDWEIFDPNANSDAQRDAVQDCDVFIASRYHPNIFASSAGVPGICFAYEHKMTGYMQQIGMERFAFPIDDLSSEAVNAALDEIYDNRDALSAALLTASERMNEVSRRTTDRAVELLHRSQEP